MLFNVFANFQLNRRQAGGVAQVVDHLPSKFKALHLNPVTTSPAPKTPSEDS
jgi:hypothetical protein